MLQRVTFTKPRLSPQQQPADLKMLVEQPIKELLGVNCRLQQEILEHRQVDESLWHTAPRYRTLTKNSSDVVAIVKVNVGRIVRYVRPSAAKALEYKLEPLIGQALPDLVYRNNHRDIHERKRQGHSRKVK